MEVMACLLASRAGLLAAHVLIALFFPCMGACVHACAWASAHMRICT